ncbi:MAG: heat-shock protein [Methanolobus sp.]
MNMDVNTENPFVQALVISTTMAVFMVGVAFGLMSLATNGLDVPMFAILLVFAVIFIAGSVYFESRGADYMGSLAGGAIISLVATFSTTAFFTGVKFAIEDGISSIGADQVVSALAVCMIASMFLIRYCSTNLIVLFKVGIMQNGLLFFLSTSFDFKRPFIRKLFIELQTITSSNAYYRSQTMRRY